MKAPLKYAIFSILYLYKEGIWEYEVYNLLKNHYNKRALSKIRSILLEMHNKAWTDEVDQEVFQDSIIRKFRLQERHREFVAYQLNPQKILAELSITEFEKVSKELVK